MISANESRDVLVWFAPCCSSGFDWREVPEASSKSRGSCTAVTERPVGEQ